jgi:hypothetical protein
MTRWFYAFLWLCCVAKLGFPQSNQGGRLSGMGKASAAVKDLWGVAANPASITATKRPSAQISYENHFFITDLSSQAFAFAFSRNNNAFGINLQRHGISEHLTIKAGFITAKQFGPNLSMGLRGNYHQLKITNYGAITAFSIDIGIMYQLADELVLGMNFNNPAKTGSKTNLTIPSTINIGVSYQSNAKVLVAGTMIKELNSPLNVAFGIDYQIIDRFSLRSGLNLNPLKHHFGVGFISANFLTDIAVTKYSHFNYSPQISIGYVF